MRTVGDQLLHCQCVHYYVDRASKTEMETISTKVCFFFRGGGWRFAAF